jgi:hypothetical protein
MAPPLTYIPCPYHLQQVEGLNPADYPRRAAFVSSPHLYLAVCSQLKQCLSKVALRTSIMLVWSGENPHAILLLRHHQFFINLWTGIVRDLLISSYVLPSRLAGATYHNFLCVLVELMEDVCL